MRRRQRSFLGNRSHLQRLLDALQSRSQGVQAWNDWRKARPTLRPDLRGVELGTRDLENGELSEMDLHAARLFKAELPGVKMWSADLRNADLRGALLDRAQLNYSDLRQADLRSARLVGADLTLVSAQGASFRGADLSHAVLGGARLQGADLRGARVSGTSAWEVVTDHTTRQEGLVIDQWCDPLEDLVDYPRASIENIIVRTDNIEAAHLLYLVSTRGKFATVIDAMTERVVLLLGNFGSHRKAVLNAMRQKLAAMGYAPVVFDFAPPVNRDLIETIAVIAGLARFVIADLTRPKSTPLETLLIAPQIMVPFASVIYRAERPFSTFRALQAKYDWMLPTQVYRNQDELIRLLETRVVKPCERMRARLNKRRQAAREVVPR